MFYKQLDKDIDFILSETNDLWINKKNKTIFLTGGTGFFGIWLIMSFIKINIKLNLNCKMIVLSRDVEKFLSKHNWLKDYNEVNFVQGNITSFEFFKDPVDFVIHAATEQV